MKKVLLTIICAVLLIGCTEKIDRKALVSRNNPHITLIDTLASLSLGNGGFTFTADITGLQTYPELYCNGIPLGTMSGWGWHSFPNTEEYTLRECLVAKDFGRGKTELYACQASEGRHKAAAEYVRSNPHRLHLGYIGFANLLPQDISETQQTLDMWNGILHSHFKAKGEDVDVKTVVHPESDIVSAQISSKIKMPITIRFAYPTGAHTDDASDWSNDKPHTTEIIEQDNNTTIVKRCIDNTTYYLIITTEKANTPQITAKNTITITPNSDEWQFSVLFTENPQDKCHSAESCIADAANHWKNFWKDGAAVDFSKCKDKRAAELERRVVLSQYLTAIQCSATTPPQETGLTYNSWYGKFHMEMIWWHQAHFALWNRSAMLERTMPWYLSAAEEGRSIAQRQGFNGIRWMKMTDPSAKDTPSDIGTYLIWQQPHIIYLAHLLQRSGSNIDKYKTLLEETAEFMVDFATYDSANDRYILKGCIPAQQTLKPETTVNPPFELAYWRYGLNTVNKMGAIANVKLAKKADEMAKKMSSLAESNGLYTAAESNPETYSQIELTSDHPAVLAAYGMLPNSPQFNAEVMRHTLYWVMENWNWNKTWGWDFPLTSMCAVRLGEPEIAVEALLKDVTTNTYLPNGHNYQNSSLRCYLPGNGGLLTAMALMCAGYDGCTEKNPGFPKDGNWDVHWEGLLPLP